MKGHPTQRQRTVLAYDVYQEVMDTAGWLRSWMRGPFESFDLTPQGFRLLVLLQEGPIRAVEAAKKLRFRRQNLDPVLGRLEERGWVKRAVVSLPKAEGQEKRSRRRKIGRKQRDWDFGVVTLTPEGEKFLGRAFPSHAKVLKGLMRALHVREQKTLIEICRKLRAGAILKFMSEISAVDEWERDAYQEIDAADEEIEDARAKLLRREVSETEDAELRELQEELGIVPFSMERLSAEDRKHVEGIITKMRKHDVLRSATQVDWNLPRDAEREAGHVLRMLMNLGDDREREVLEKLRRGRSDLEVVEMLKEWSRVE
ncbi:MAG: MarR family winged helix-turn-helix transcriptional regulator [Candidatus Acidiferrales bacterium]